MNLILIFFIMIFYSCDKLIKVKLNISILVHIFLHEFYYFYTFIGLSTLSVLLLFFVLRGAMVSLIPSSAVDCGIKPWSGRICI